MPTQKCLFLSIENCGDGSAVARLYDSKALTEIVQEYSHEPWAEECAQIILIESETPITVVTKVHTLAEEIAETTSDFDYVEGNEEEEARITQKLAQLNQLMNTEG